MTFLPIIERELRVRARSRASYWSRCAVVLMGALACLPQLLWSGPFGTAAALGPGLLAGLVIAAFLLCCGACLLTADIISAERREGTLGLLFLTRVRGFDVLAGKLGSAGLTGLCALAAFVPLLMLPVLAGGVTGGEAFRKGLVLPDTLFLALAAGLWASAGGCEGFKTARTSLLLVAAILLGPGLFELILGRALLPGLSFWLLSPLGALLSAGDVPYHASPGRYWTSLILVQATAWALVISAGFRLRSAWPEETGEADAPAPRPASEGVAEPDGPWLSCTWTPPVPSAAAGDETETAPLPSRRLADDANPIAWLLQRQRGTQVILWAAALVAPPYLFQLVVFRLPGASGYISVVWLVGLVLTALGSALIAWAASRFFVAARGTGELELLLTTPFGAKEMVRTQWAVLKRRLRWPMLIMVAPVALQAGLAILSIRSSAFGPPNSFQLPIAMSSLISCVNTFLEVGALCWVGLWFGLKAGGQARAIVWTVSLVNGLPTLLGIFCSFALNALIRPWAGNGAVVFWMMMCPAGSRGPAALPLADQAGAAASAG